MMNDDNIAPEDRTQSDHSTVVENVASIAMESEKYSIVITYRDIFRQFVLLGWTAFGGPSAHIALFQKIFIEKLDWMATSVFMELFALGQCLPGPTSTQVSFAIGVVKKGILGGLLSGMLFQYPGLVIMSLIGWGADSVDWSHDALKAFASALGAVGVALVAGSAFQLSIKTCPDRETRLLNLMSTVVAYMYATWWIFPTLIVVGGLVTVIRDRNKPINEAPGREGIESFGVGKVAGAILLVCWLSVLIAVIAVRNSGYPYEGSGKALYWFEAFYRTGSIIYGGGQVVLPMLLEEVVKYKTVCTGSTCKDIPDYQYYGNFSDPNVRSWVTQEQFLAGLGIAQAMPGPLFNFAAYLGAITAARAGQNILTGVSTCWFGLFSPGIILIFGALPFWSVFRKSPIYRRALPGLNAAAVGLVVTAVFSLYDTVRSTSPFPDTAVAIGLLGFVAVEIYKVPAPAAIVVCGGLGVFGWAVKLRWIGTTS